jgi:hypothetical protein
MTQQSNCRSTSYCGLELSSFVCFVYVVLRSTRLYFEDSSVLCSPHT